MISTVLDTPIGPLTLTGGDDGLRSVRFGLHPAEEAAPRHTHSILDKAREQLEEYFDGDRTAFDLLLDLSQGTSFQRARWCALADIPYGTTTTYGNQALRLGTPRAVRAVAAANGRNPLPIVLPCHRVIGASDRSRGSAAGAQSSVRCCTSSRESARSARDETVRC